MQLIAVFLKNQMETAIFFLFAYIPAKTEDGAELAARRSTRFTGALPA